MPALFAACSSGSGGASLPSCKGAGEGMLSASCQSCVTSKCASQVSGQESACSTYNACYEACQCNDGNCLSGCMGKATSACQTAIAELGSCLESTCKSECSTTVTIGSGGGTTSGGANDCAALFTCCGKLPAAEQSSCLAVANGSTDANCAAELSSLQSAGKC